MSNAIREQRRFVVGLARHLGRGSVDPEDLAQDVLERWLRWTPNAGPVHNAEAWMTVVLRRLLVDRLRSRRARPEVAFDEATAPPPAEDDAPPWWSALDQHAVERELPALPPALRETFSLFTFEARSYAQIARDLNIAKGTVAARINRARALLRQRLVARAASCA